MKRFAIDKITQELSSRPMRLHEWVEQRIMRDRIIDWQKIIAIASGIRFSMDRRRIGYLGGTASREGLTTMLGLTRLLRESVMEMPGWVRKESSSGTVAVGALHFSRAKVLETCFWLVRSPVSSVESTLSGGRKPAIGLSYVSDSSRGLRDGRGIGLLTDLHHLQAVILAIREHIYCHRLRHFRR